MTEKEKGLSGLLYNPNRDKALQREMMVCKDRCFRYNQIPPLDAEAREQMISDILGSRGIETVILPPFWCDYGGNIRVGDYFFANHGLTILDGAPITFGDNVFIAPNCCFSAAGHPIDARQRAEGLEYAYPITVGNDVWFGAGVTVLPGVTIGSNVVIGAGSVVNRDIPSGVVAVGNPCKVLRKITEEDAKRYLERPSQSSEAVSMTGSE